MSEMNTLTHVHVATQTPSPHPHTPTPTHHSPPHPHPLTPTPTAPHPHIHTSLTLQQTALVLVLRWEYMREIHAQREVGHFLQYTLQVVSTGLKHTHHGAALVLHSKLIGVRIHSDRVGHIQAADLGRTTHGAEQTSRFKPTSSRADTWSFVSHTRRLSTFSSLVCETTWSGDRCMAQSAHSTVHDSLTST